MPGVAVVTGAGRGFGREIAQQLAARGYTVLATDIDGEAAAATAERSAASRRSSTCATPRRTAARRAPRRARAARGLGQQRRRAAHAQGLGAPDDEVRLMVEINMLGVIWGSRAAVDAMRSAAARTCT